MIRISVAGLILAAWLLASPGRAEGSAACPVTPALLDLGVSFPHLGEKVRRGEPLVVVAIGSSSTAGAGATLPAHSYPEQLARLWPKFMPGLRVTVHNRGKNGDELEEMRSRFSRDIFADRPDIILLQIGTNAVLRRDGIEDFRAPAAAAIADLRASGAAVVLIDQQYAPRVLADPDHLRMQTLLAQVAREGGAGLFQRFALMRHWRQGSSPSPDRMMTADGLHLSDTGYHCWARALAQSLTRALEKP